MNLGKSGINQRRSIVVKAFRNILGKSLTGGSPLFRNYNESKSPTREFGITIERLPTGSKRSD